MLQAVDRLNHSICNSGHEEYFKESKERIDLLLLRRGVEVKTKLLPWCLLVKSSLENPYTFRGVRGKKSMLGEQKAQQTI